MKTKHNGRFTRVFQFGRISGWLLWVGFAIAWLFPLQGCNEDDPVTPDQPTEQVKQNIGPAGGTLVLSGGVTVVIPPDAMASTKEIVISKYKPSDFFDGDVSHYIVIGCAPDGETFQKPVEIYFTAPEDLESGQIDGVVGLIDAESGAMEVYPTTGLTIEGKNTLKIETSHFSKYAGHFWEYPPYEAETLEIPHFNQGDSPYCWAAGLQMICEAVRHDPVNEIHDIIGYVGIDEAGANPYTFRFSSRIAGMVKSRTGSSPDRKIWPLGSAYAMDGYIKDRIALGFPVLVSSPTEEHAFVVVGYRGNTFYINDPASVEYNGFLSYTSKTKADFKIDEMGVWDRFVTISIPAEIPSSGRLQTVNISDHGITFIEPKPAPNASPAYFYRYNCHVPEGYTFNDENNLAYDVIPGNVKEFHFTGLQLSNTNRTQSSSIKVWIYITGLNNKKIFKSIPPTSTLTVPANSMITYPITIPISDFADDTPSPTDYKMQIVAMDAGGTVLDDAFVLFTLGPPPSWMEFTCYYQVEYADGDFGTVSIEGENEGEPLRLSGFWSGNIYKAQNEVTYEGLRFKQSMVVTCNSDRSQVDVLELRFTVDDVEDVLIRAENIDLELIDNLYQFDLEGEDACSPLTEIYFGDDIFGAIVDYFCDETSYLSLQIPK